MSPLTRRDVIRRWGYGLGGLAHGGSRKNRAHERALRGSKIADPSLDLLARALSSHQDRRDAQHEPWLCEVVLCAAAEGAGRLEVRLAAG